MITPCHGRHKHLSLGHHAAQHRVACCCISRGTRCLHSSSDPPRENLSCLGVGLCEACEA